MNSLEKAPTKLPVFLQAEWRKLAMANYKVDPSLLLPYLPKGTELDAWHGLHFVSLVGFLFDKVRLKGIPIPFHTRFEEVNLRFYVRCKDQSGWKRGVVFVKEIVPKRAISWVANTLYKERYQTSPMHYKWTENSEILEVEYHWKVQNWHRFQVACLPTALPFAPDSIEEFITEHYWGYSRGSGKKTMEYGVEHPSWNVYPTVNWAIDVDFEQNYGNEFAFLNQQEPHSVFVAEGSPVIVRHGRKIFSS